MDIDIVIEGVAVWFGEISKIAADLLRIRHIACPSAADFPSEGDGWGGEKAVERTVERWILDNRQWDGGLLAKVIQLDR